MIVPARAAGAGGLVAVALLLASCSGGDTSHPAGCDGYDTSRTKALQAVADYDAAKIDQPTELTRLADAAQGMQDASDRAQGALVTQLRAAASDLATSVDAQRKRDPRRVVSHLTGYQVDLQAVDTSCGFRRSGASAPPGASSGAPAATAPPR